MCFSRVLAKLLFSRQSWVKEDLLLLILKIWKWMFIFKKGLVAVCSTQIQQE